MNCHYYWECICSNNVLLHLIKGCSWKDFINFKKCHFFLTKRPEPPISSSKYSQCATREFSKCVSSGDGNQWGGCLQNLPGNTYQAGFWHGGGGGAAVRVWITSLIGQQIMVYRLFTQRVITGFSKRGKKAEVWSLAEV